MTHRRVSPVGNAVVRLFEPKYNKLVETTPPTLGRYSFLVGPNEYFGSIIIAEGYEERIACPIDYRERREPWLLAN